MLFIVLLTLQFHLGNFCNICVTQPLLTSNVECPICTLSNSLVSEYVEVSGKCEGGSRFCDENNPYNWTTCNIVSPICDPSYKYRSFDGSCNNLEHPTWGMTETAYTRLLPPNYRDGKHLIRLSSSGDELPLVRHLSNTFFTSGDIPDAINLMAMQWGQIVAHDIAITLPLGDYDCCNPSTYNENKCLAFIYAPDDYFYSKFNVTCDNFQRNIYTQVGNDCETGPAQQVNGDSHPIDGSLIYGSNLNTANSLRTFDAGRLRARRMDDGREFLPSLPPTDTSCFVLSDTEPCYIAGDLRVNQNTQISVLSNMLLRAHNNIAHKLEKIHIDWNDEQLYQETRRILVAVLQHIHYKEWLPFYVGKSAMKKHDLYPKARGYTNYNSKINLIGINSFGAGAFRGPHSGIQGILNMYNHDHHFGGSVSMTDWMQRPHIVEQGCNYDKFLLGLIIQPMQKFDKVFAHEMKNLNLRGFKPHGTDLISTDILRGRDNGLAPYVHYLEICTGFKATAFDDLEKFMTPESVLLLKNTYASLEDIDLFVGGLLEEHVDNSRLGATFLCIFVEQFYRLKWGDRFWYEVGGQPHSFTREQLKEIRKMTVSKLICDNSDKIERMPLSSFLPISESNIIEDCNNIPGIDFYKF